MQLPPDLQSALAETLSTTTTRTIAPTAEKLSQRYRAGHARHTSLQQNFLHTEQDILAYAAYRLPATFAAVSSALMHIRAARPGWHPRSILDLGAGPGTATWAAMQIWPEIEQATLYERNRHMLDYGKKLAAQAHSSVLQQATWLQGDITAIPPAFVGAYDLVIVAYVLGEMPLALHTTLTEALWACTTDTLLLIEPGTPGGFSLIRNARTHLLAQGASIIAPCPHQEACPMPENDWCHFSQRITRTRWQRSVKGAALAYEDEKFSYCAFSKDGGSSIAGRVLRHPQKRSGYIQLELCTPVGLRHMTVTRSQRAAYREAHDIQWGDALGNALSDALAQHSASQRNRKKEQ